MSMSAISVAREIAQVDAVIVHGDGLAQGRLQPGQLRAFEDTSSRVCA